MKKHLFILSTLLTFALSSCAFLDYINIKPTPSTHDDSITSEEISSEDSSAEEGSSIETSGDSSGEESITSTSEAVTPSKVKFDTNYRDLANRNPYGSDYCPIKGNGRVLVIPVWFSDSSNFIDVNHKDDIRSDIEKAWFGTDIDTGWKSVATYYEEDSFGTVHLSGTVTDWYTVSNSYVTYGTDTDYCTKTTDLVENAVSWYKNSIGSTLSDFDSDNSGYLDTVVLVYAAPDYNTMGSNLDNLWAYCYWCFGAESNTYNPPVNAFIWVSYDFMYGSNKAYERTGKTSYGGGNTTTMNVDPHTFIHEMGHAFGLDDYYDYYNKERAPLANTTMQDCNVGSHDPFSRLALGWVNPYIVTNEHDNYEVTIGGAESGDVILIKNSAPESPFDEYILVDYYTPTGLNEFDSEHEYKPGVSNYSLTSASGVRLFHIDAKLLEWSYDYSKGDWVYDATIGGLVTTMKNGDYYYSIGISNTSGGSRVEPTLKDYNLNYYIRNYKMADSFSAGDNFNGDNMFKEGSSFELKNFKGQFNYNNAFDNGESFDFRIEVTKLTSESATISITL